ncbi:hypothetical protein GCM10023205_74080 [Yinghuangia aomiensis]|uniref:Uncharacterized protein n=1 Tax=Yinghuangia aomiensis TaxID=676205 RepID=A0ABP9I9D8_9ACTN
MGSFSELMVVRADQSALELKTLRPHLICACAADTSCWHKWHIAGGGWQIVDVSGAHPGASGLLAPLVAETGAPVLVAHLVDSDTAYLEALGPESGAWEGWIEAYFAPEYAADRLVGDALNELADRLAAELPERAKRAVAWAVEAGWAPDYDQVLAAMRAKETFAEDQLMNVLNAMGMPAAG